MMIQLYDGSQVPLACTVCGEPAVTTLYATALASSVHPAPVIGNYCAEHNPQPNIHTSERGVSKAAFLTFMDIFYHQGAFRLIKVYELLQDARDLDPTMREWLEEWVKS